VEFYKSLKPHRFKEKNHHNPEKPPSTNRETAIALVEIHCMFKDPLQPGLMYHIYNRGNNRENLFKEDKNYFHFLNLSQKHLLPIADIFSYSLQPNHFHYLIQIKDAIENKLINQSFSNWFNAYTKSINIAYNRTGSLFQERFARKLIDTNTYLNNIIFYIHANAQKHRLVEDFRSYKYNSYDTLLSDKATFLQRDKVLNWFGNREQFAKFHAQNQDVLVDYLKILDAEGF